MFWGAALVVVVVDLSTSNFHLKPGLQLLVGRHVPHYSSPTSHQHQPGYGVPSEDFHRATVHCSARRKTHNAYSRTQGCPQR